MSLINVCNRTCVWYRALGIVLNLLGLRILDKLCLKFLLELGIFYNFQKYIYWMSSAYRIFAWIYVLLKSSKVMILNMIHSLSIQFLYTLPNLTINRLMISEIEAITPVAKVTWENEQGFRIIKILSKYFAITISHFLINRSSHDRNKFDIFT